MTISDLKNAALTYGTPLYIYDQTWLANRAEELLEVCSRHDILPRYAVKANPHESIVGLFDGYGLAFDASSEYEAQRLISLGVEPPKISLSSQQPPRDMRAALGSGLKFVATSLHQLELVKASGWHGEIGVRLNPGIGSGHNNRTTTGGRNASFGIWHEYIKKVLDWEATSSCQITRLHIHIGSGGDAHSWREVIKTSLELAEQFPNLESLDMGGGFKVARIEGEQAPDLAEILSVYADELKSFNHKKNRELGLEIEPGTWLVAGGGTLLAEIIDVVDTGEDGYKFLKLNTGMNDLLRPALYGAQHPIQILNDASEQEEYVVVGHNCESGDILTPTPGDPESIQPRLLNSAAIGDLVAIGFCGAYSASMRASGYNSFPPAEEVMV